MIKGHVINRFGLSGIRMQNTGTNYRVEGNFIDTDAPGTAPSGNSGFGVFVGGTNNASIGGASPAARFDLGQRRHLRRSD